MAGACLGLSVRWSWWWWCVWWGSSWWSGGQEGRVITPSPDQYVENTININHYQEDKVDIFTEFDAKELVINWQRLPDNERFLEETHKLNLKYWCSRPPKPILPLNCIMHWFVTCVKFCKNIYGKKEWEHQDDKSRCSLNQWIAPPSDFVSKFANNGCVVQILTIFQWPAHHIYKDRIKLCKMLLDNFQNMPWTINVRYLILILIRNVDILAP